MKKFLLIILVFTSFVVLAKQDIDLSNFNKELNQNIKEVIKHNPESYETQPTSLKKPLRQRSPASVVTDKIETQDPPKGKMEDLEVGLPQF